MTAKDTLTIRAAIINLCNTCIGTGILAKPFALAIVGWSGLFCFAVAACIITYIGVCLSDASVVLLQSSNKPIMSSHKKPNYNSINTKNEDITIDTNTVIINTPNIPIQKTKAGKSAYQLLAYRSMGTKGEAFAVIGFVIVVCIYLSTCTIMIFELILDIFNILMPTIFDINTRLIFLFSFALYIPTALILNWKQMTFVSYIGVISVLSIFISLVCVLIYSFHKFDFGPPPIELLTSRISNINSKNLAINTSKDMTLIGRVSYSLVLFLFGVSGNAAIPKISTSVNTKRDMIIVVMSSYCSVSIFYAIVASLSYWIYGEYADVMILNSFYIWPGGYFVLIVFMFVILNLWASFAILLSLFGDLMEGLINIQKNQVGHRKSIRMFLLAVMFMLSYFMRNNLAFLVVLGSAFGVLFSMALTWPLMVYIFTFWNHETKPLSIYGKIFHLLLLGLCVSIGVYVSYNDFVNYTN